LGLIFLIFTTYGIRSLLRYRRQQTYDLPYFLSRKAFLFINVLVLVAIASVVLIGTVYPLILNQFTGHMISVGAPYFTLTTAPFLLIIVTLMSIVPFIEAHAQRNLSYVATFGLACFVFLSYWKQGWPVIASLFLATALCILFSSALDLVNKWKHVSLRYVAMTLAHASIALIIMGAVIDSFEKVESLHVMKEKDSVSFQGFALILDQVDQVRAPYFQRQVASLTVNDGKQKFTLKPEKRFYPLHEMITSETDIRAVGLGDLYAVMGTSEDQNNWIIKLHWHPAIRLLWIGAGLMVLAGLLGFIAATRRLRKS